MALPLVFTGAGDDTGFADGTPLMVKMTSSDNSKTLDLDFSERVIIKRGILNYDSAPFGAKFHCHILSGTTEVHSYAKNFLIYGTGTVELDTGEESFIESGLTMRIEVFNSSGTGDEDPAGAFKVFGNLLIRRATTV